MSIIITLLVRALGWLSIAAAVPIGFYKLDTVGKFLNRFSQSFESFRVASGDVLLGNFLFARTYIGDFFKVSCHCNF